MARTTYSPIAATRPQTLEEAGKRIVALERALAQLANRPGAFTSQVIFRDVVVGDGENLLSVGPTTIPAGVTVTIGATGVWRMA
jgi:hypothetical protein